MTTLTYARAREVFTAPWWVNRIRHPAGRAARITRVTTARNPASRQWGWGAVPSDRDRRIRLAHGVLVAVAAFEAAREIIGAEAYDRAGITLWEQAGLLGLRQHGTQPDFTDMLLEAGLPFPDGPFDRHLEELGRFSVTVGAEVFDFCRGLASTGGTELDPTHRLVPAGQRATERYLSLFRRLTADAPEFNSWFLMLAMLNREADTRAAQPSIALAPQPVRVHLIFAEDQRSYVTRVAVALGEGEVQPQLHRMTPDQEHRRFRPARLAVLFVSAEHERQVWASHAALRAYQRLLADCADRVLVAGPGRVTLPGPVLADTHDLDPDRTAGLIRAELGI